MSSHHIVREKQEPALLIIDFAGFNPEYLGQLLEWSPTVIVSESAYAEVELSGIKIDAVITKNHNVATQNHTRIIETASSPIEDGLKFLTGEQYQAVNIISPAFVLKDYALYAELINLAVFTPGKKIFAVKSGFSKWDVAGKEIELVHEVVDLTTSGLEHITPSRLKTQKDGFYSLCFNQPFLFIAEDL
jgi:thiamine pyrophosphokinase